MIGMKTAEATSVANADSANGRCASMRVSTSGREVRRSMAKNQANSSREAAKLARMRGSVHPSCPPLFRGRMNSTMAAADTAAPLQSIRSPRAPSRSANSRTMRKETSAKGRLMKNTHRHEYAMSQAPATGPMEVIAPVIAKNSAIALALPSLAEPLTKMPTAAGNISADPAPWTTREEIIHTLAAGPAGVAPHRRLPAANTAIPASMTRRYPQESASFPPRGKTAAAARR